MLQCFGQFWPHLFGQILQLIDLLEKSAIFGKICRRKLFPLPNVLLPRRPEL